METKQKITTPNPILLNWLFTILIAASIFILAKPAVAKIVTQRIDLENFVQTEDLKVGTEAVGDYQQVYYQFDGKKHFITENSWNSLHPYSRGEYIVWATQVNGAGQVFRYHLPTETTIKITHSSTNLKPKVDKEGRVVWERWVTLETEPGQIKEGWQIFLFDGVEIKQLTEQTVAVDAQIKDGRLVYQEKDQVGQWQIRLYEIATGQLLDLQKGHNPRLEDQALIWDKVIQMDEEKEAVEEQRYDLLEI